MIKKIFFICIGIAGFIFLLSHFFGVFTAEKRNEMLFPEILNSTSIKPSNFWFPISETTDVKIFCDSENPKSVKNWRKELHADFVVNGGYFDENFIPVGYVKIDEKQWGKLENYPAFIGIEKNEIFIGRADEKKEKKYSQVIESFPLLVENSQPLFLRETKKYANRTIIGKKNGQWGFYFILTFPSLYQTSHRLVEENFSVALNLDGGPSVGFSSSEKEILSSKVACVFAGFDK